MAPQNPDLRLNAVQDPDLPQTRLASDSFAVTGRFIKVACLRNKYDEVTDPESILQILKTCGPSADLFTFSQKLPHTKPKYLYHLEWDNVAAIPIESYEHWWNELVNKKVRKHVRRAQKGGVVVKKVEFNDALVRGIMRIYNETPVRSGRPFRHYGDDFATCKAKHATYLDRSEFIGAFLEEELIGFVKMVYAGQTARTIQNISMLKYGQLAPGNALLAKAVEICAHRGMAYLVYGKMEYDNRGNKSFEEFKRDNGFQLVRIPTYFVVLTPKGKIALKLRLHRRLDTLLPRQWFNSLRALRGWYYLLRYRADSATPAIKA